MTPIILLQLLTRGFDMTKIIQFLVISCLFAFNGVLAVEGLPDFTQLVEEHGSAVVNISTTMKKKNHKDLFKREFSSPAEEEAFNELFKRFFDFEGGKHGEKRSTPHRPSPLGSGFIISEDGYVVTNHHVIRDADEITVKLTDRREFKAKLIGSDERSDVALLKIEAKALPFLHLGNSKDLKVGEWVLAIGSPFGFDNSVTAGIVSAKGRNLPTDNYVPFIQTDVAINPGNSGGPLFDMKGDVVGINSQIYSRSGGSMGVSFAIPASVALTVIDQLKTKGSVSRAWLGVYIQEVDRDLAKTFKMPLPTGALVAKIIKDGPAVGHLELGDIILEFNGQVVPNVSKLPNIVGQTEIGKAVDVKVLRNASEKIIKITLGELPSENEVEKQKDAPEIKPEIRDTVLGLEIEDLNDDVRKSTGVDAGVLVGKVDNGAGKEAGLMEGNIISMVDGQKIDSVKQLKSVIESLTPEESVAILIHQNGSARFLALKVPKSSKTDSE